ncbi:MAG: type I phosphomannose isomerase catalytic subunit [Cytophagaceae bacterium]
MVDNTLYPFVFKTIFKEKLWGGQKIKSVLGKDFGSLPNCGETWELSAVEGNVSIVANGKHENQSLNSLIQRYKADLVGRKVWEKYGEEFPLLIKFIDAAEDLSIQVHPDDKMAARIHGGNGKSEMWYILAAEENATLNSGFNQPISKEQYLTHLNANTLNQILNIEKVTAGDVFYLPAGRIHYIGKGILLAEIQQTSDYTYRVYDFDRKDSNGNKRELHTELALEALDFTYYKNYKSDYSPQVNSFFDIQSTPYFTTTGLQLNKEYSVKYPDQDSCKIIVVTDGEGHMQFNGEMFPLKKGMVILVPAIINELSMTPKSNLSLLHVTIN